MPGFDRVADIDLDLRYVPANWTCDPDRYDAGDGICDCDCTASDDADCTADNGCPVVPDDNDDEDDDDGDDGGCTSMAMTPSLFVLGGLLRRRRQPRGCRQLPAGQQRRGETGFAHGKPHRY